MAKFGHQVSRANAAHFAPDLDVVRSGEDIELQPPVTGRWGR